MAGLGPTMPAPRQNVIQPRMVEALPPPDIESRSKSKQDGQTIQADFEDADPQLCIHAALLERAVLSSARFLGFRATAFVAPKRVERPLNCACMSLLPLLWAQGQGSHLRHMKRAPR